MPLDIALRLCITRLWCRVGVRELERRTVACGRPVSRGAISSLEMGRQSRTEIETISRLATALRVPPEWLAFGVGCPIPAAKLRQLKVQARLMYRARVEDEEDTVRAKIAASQVRLQEIEKRRLATEAPHPEVPGPGPGK